MLWNSNVLKEIKQYGHMERVQSVRKAIKLNEDRAEKRSWPCRRLRSATTEYCTTEVSWGGFRPQALSSDCTKLYQFVPKLFTVILLKETTRINRCLSSPCCKQYRNITTCMRNANKTLRTSWTLSALKRSRYVCALRLPGVLHFAVLLFVYLCSVQTELPDGKQ